MSQAVYRERSDVSAARSNWEIARSSAKTLRTTNPSKGAASLKLLVKKVLFALAQRVPLAARGAAFIASRGEYERLRQQFLHNGARSVYGQAVRSRILDRFELIDRAVPSGTTPSDGLYIAEMVLSLSSEGSLVECGCYAGASSTKLSILAEECHRDLVICDSFEGLPAVAQDYLRDHHCRHDDAWVMDWSAGRYAAGVEAVRSNIVAFGEISACSFVKGWFCDTLAANLPNRIALAFVDVDLANSAQDCFVEIWPRLGNGGVYVTHDTAYIKVLQQLYDPDLWQTRLMSTPPILFGAGYGLSDSSPHLGYMVKGDGLSASYLKELTIAK